MYNLSKKTDGLLLDSAQCTKICVQFQVQSIEVAGPRYWSQVVDRCNQSALSQVYNSLQIFVKKKSGMLSYTQDPLGNRTLLSSAFHQSYFMPSPQGGYDLVNLCATYASDLSIMSFAHIFCLTGVVIHSDSIISQVESMNVIRCFMHRSICIYAGSSFLWMLQHCYVTGGREASNEPNSTSDATHRFQLFCRKALYDCITGEKPEMLQTHVYLYSLVHGIAIGPENVGTHHIPGLVTGVHGIQVDLAFNPCVICIILNLFFLNLLFTNPYAFLYPGGALTVGLWNLKMCRELYRCKFGRALLSTAGEKEHLHSRMDCGAPERSDERGHTDKG